MQPTITSGQLRLFLFGFIVILFEVIFTRFASAYFQYHFAFVLLSMAMLSFCLSGMIYQAATKKAREQLFNKMALLLPASFLLLLFLLVFSVNFLASSLIGAVSIVVLGFGILFACSFLIVSLLDREGEPGLSYGINLLGSGAGGLAAILLLSLGDPYKALAVCSILGVFGIEGITRKRNLAFFAVLCLAFSLPFLLISIKNPAAAWEEWNSFSKVSVYADQPECVVWGGTIYSADELPAAFNLNIDSGAATAIVLEPDKYGVLARDVTHAGYYFLENGSGVAIVGSGGGRDVVAAKEFNLSGIKAIEINPLVIEAVGIFSPQTYEGVDIVVADGRETLGNSGEKFDLVQLSLVDTWAAVSSGSHALTENYLYTKEAFGTYLGSVDEDGIVSITYWDSYRGKLLSLAFAALRESGVEDPSKNVIVFKQGEVSTILVKKDAWSGEEIALAEDLAKKNNYLLVLPEKEYGGIVNTDDSPFFFFNQDGFLILVCVVAMVSAILLTSKRSIFLALRKTGRSTILFFALIGLGFMTVEAVFVQRFLLAIHDPTITVALVFTSFLVFSGIGSILSKRMAFRYSLLLAPLLLVFAFGWGEIVPLLYQMDLAAKIAISVGIMAPFAFLMGTFFPKGLEYLKANKLDEIGDAWTINGLASVFAPIITIGIAVVSGFTAALVMAAIAYLASWALGMKEFGERKR